MRKILGDQRGYFTLEASFIVPVTLFIVFGIILISLSIYDLGTAKSFLNQETMYITDTIKTDGKNSTGKFNQKELVERPARYLLQQSYPKRAAEAKRLLMSELQKKLIISKVTNLSFVAGQKKVEGKLSLSFIMPITVIGELTGKLWRTDLSVTLENGCNAEQMRRWDFLE